MDDGNNKSVNQDIGENLNRLANMSIKQLKILLNKVKKGKAEEDKQLAKIIKSIIDRRKTDNFILQQFAKNQETRFRR